MATPQEVEAGLTTETNELTDEDILKYGGVNPSAESEPEPADESPAEDEAPSSTVQPTTSQGKPDKAKPKQPVNLDDFEDFRKWKSESDRKQAELKRKLEEAEARAAQREQAEQQYMLKGLQAQLNDAEDDNQRLALIEQMAAIRSQTYVSQERAWAKHVRERATTEGLDPEAFDPTRYRGEAGALQFERDVAQAAKEKLSKELADAKKAASPQAIADLVRQEVAKSLRSKGVDTGVATATPSAPPADDSEARARDWRLVQSGRMEPSDFLKKHGSK